MSIVQQDNFLFETENNAINSLKRVSNITSLIPGSPSKWSWQMNDNAHNYAQRTSVLFIFHLNEELTDNR